MQGRCQGECKLERIGERLPAVAAGLEAVGDLRRHLAVMGADHCGRGRTTDPPGDGAPGTRGIGKQRILGLRRRAAPPAARDPIADLVGPMLERVVDASDRNLGLHGKVARARRRHASSIADLRQRPEHEIVGGRRRRSPRCPLERQVRDRPRRYRRRPGRDRCGTSPSAARPQLLPLVVRSPVGGGLGPGPPRRRAGHRNLRRTQRPGRRTGPARLRVDGRLRPGRRSYVIAACPSRRLLAFKTGLPAVEEKVQHLGIDLVLTFVLRGHVGGLLLLREFKDVTHVPLRLELEAYLALDVHRRPGTRGVLDRPDRLGEISSGDRATRPGWSARPARAARAVLSAARSKLSCGSETLMSSLTRISTQEVEGNLSAVNASGISRLTCGNRNRW